MSKIHLSGRLRHCFFGDYQAIIVLGADSPEHMRAARPKLGSLWDKATPNDAGDVLRLVVGRDLVGAAVAELEGRRVDKPDDCPWCRGRSPRRRDCTKRTGREPIAGVRHSIDLGPSFVIEVELDP